MVNWRGFGHLNTVASTIFNVCNETLWHILADRTLVVDLARQACSMLPKTDPMPGDSAVMVCPMEPIYVMLRDHLVHSSPITVETARGHGAEILEPAATGEQH